MPQTKRWYKDDLGQLFPDHAIATVAAIGEGKVRVDLLDGSSLRCNGENEYAFVTNPEIVFVD